MGLIRKATSLSTLGGVKYTSKREAQTKAALAQARVAREEEKQLKDQRRAAQKDAIAEKWDPVVAAIESGESSWDDLTRLQKLSMPISYQLKCKAAQKHHDDAAQ